MRFLSSKVVSMLAVVLVMFLGNFASALNLSPSTNTNRNSNPWMRTCRIAGGVSLVLPLDQDQVLLCNLDGALLGSYDLFLLKTASKQTVSVQTLVAGITQISACERIVKTDDVEGNTYHLCVFSDGSMVDKTSLEKGLSHPDNQKLNEVLQQPDSQPSHFSIRPKI